MLTMQGTIKAVKVTVSQQGMSRQVTFDIGGDSILDELQEIMRAKSRLNITLATQQLEIGVTMDQSGKIEKRKGVQGLTQENQKELARTAEDGE